MIIQKITVESHSKALNDQLLFIFLNKLKVCDFAASSSL